MSEKKKGATGVDFIMYLVKDMKKMRAFYEGVFRLKVGDFESERFVEYELPDGAAFALAVAPTGSHMSCGGAMFAIADVDETVKSVKEHGGTFYTNFSGKSCETGWCSDPEGNPFGVHARKTEHSH